MALDSTALAQTVVAAAAALKDGTTGALELNAASLRDYATGVRAVRKLMQNNDQGMLVQDTAVLTLVFIAVSCLTFGLREDLRQHCNGIRALVALKGGLHNYAASTAHLIQWVEYYDSLYHNDTPTFGVPSSALVTLENPPMEQFRSEFHRVEYSLNCAILKACQDIVSLTCLLNEAMEGPTKLARFNYYMYKRNAVRTDIQRLHAAFYNTGCVDECVIYALQSYRLVALTGVFTEVPLIHMCENMIVALRKTDLKSDWRGEGMQNLLIWCLWCTGGLVTDKWLEGKQWFARMLKRLLGNRYCKITSPTWFDGWRNLEMLQLENFVWSSKLLLPRFDAMCDMIERSSTREIGNA